MLGMLGMLDMLGIVLFASVLLLDIGGLATLLDIESGRGGSFITCPGMIKSGLGILLSFTSSSTVVLYF